MKEQCLLTRGFPSSLKGEWRRRRACSRFLSEQRVPRLQAQGPGSVWPHDHVTTRAAPGPLPQLFTLVFGPKFLSRSYEGCRPPPHNVLLVTVYVPKSDDSLFKNKSMEPIWGHPYDVIPSHLHPDVPGWESEVEITAHVSKPNSATAHRN